MTLAQSTERISLHLFDLPDGVSIEEFKADLNRANNIYEKNGFGADRYKVYQVKADDKMTPTATCGSVPEQRYRV